MSISYITTAILAVALITNLTVEGLKKLLNDTTIKYSSNVLAAIVSVVVALAISVMYMIMQDAVFTPKIGVQIVSIMYLSFLSSTVGYDKVIQMIAQIKNGKQE